MIAWQTVCLHRRQMTEWHWNVLGWWDDALIAYHIGWNVGGIPEKRENVWCLIQGQKAGESHVFGGLCDKQQNCMCDGGHISWKALPGRPPPQSVGTASQLSSGCWPNSFALVVQYNLFFLCLRRSRFSRAIVTVLSVLRLLNCCLGCDEEHVHVQFVYVPTCLYDTSTSLAANETPSVSKY